MKTTHICVTSGLSFLASSYHTTLHLLPIFNFSNRHTNDQTPSPLIFSHAFMIPLLLCYRKYKFKLIALHVHCARTHKLSLSLSLSSHSQIHQTSIAFSPNLILSLNCIFKHSKVVFTIQCTKTSTFPNAQNFY